MKKIIVMTIKLLVITVIAGGLLGFVNAITKEPIALQEAKAADAARFAAFADAETFVKMEIDISEDFSLIQNVYAAQDAQGNDIGVVIGILTKGYSAGLNLTVGLSTEGVITGVAIGTHQETPGFGANASDAKFIDQYIDVPFDSPLVVVKADPSSQNEIQSITGATITSASVTHAVNRAVEYFTQVLGTGSNVTNEAIAEQEAKLEDEDMLTAFPGAISFEAMNIQIPEKYAPVNGVFSAFDAQGNEIGIVVDITAKGYSEGLDLLVGLKSEGTVAGLVVKADAETPGLGTLAADPKFTGQYKDVPFDTPLVIVNGEPTKENEIQVVSGATITSRSVTVSVNAAASFYAEVVGVDIAVPTAPPIETTAPSAVPTATAASTTPAPTPTIPLTERDVDPADYDKYNAFPFAETFALLDIEIPESYGFIDSYHTAYDADGNDIGVVVEITTNGYYFGINYTVGFSRQGEITGIVFGENLSDPEMGKEMDTELFTEQFAGMRFDKELIVAMMDPTPIGEIDAVAGATIMSVDVTYYISEAARFYINVIGGVS